MAGQAAATAQDEPRSEDRLLGGRVSLRQPVAGYRVAIDPVMLAAALESPPGARVLDLGCGVGGAALCLLARQPDVSVVGLELQPELAELARENARLNGQAARFQVVTGDAADLACLDGETFDAVITNPPFQAAGAGRAPKRANRALAHQESSLDLTGWLQRALQLLKPKGRLVLIHRADRLPELLTALEGRAGGLAILPLWPRQGQVAKRVILCAVKGSRAPAALLPGLVLHGAGQGFTPEAEAVLRDAAPLDLTP